jgi:hypothetical protein
MRGNKMLINGDIVKVIISAFVHHYASIIPACEMFG